MANNYDQATLEPDIPAALLTPERRALLQSVGFSIEEYGDCYLYAEEGVQDEAYDEAAREHVPVNWIGVLQDIAREGDIPEFVIMGAFYCSKMRSGEFGGYITRITADTVQSWNTVDALTALRNDPTLFAHGS